MARAVLSINRKRLRLECSVTDRVKATRGMGASPVKGGAYTYPLDEVVVLVLKHHFGDDLVMTPDCELWFNETQATAKAMFELAQLEDSKVPLKYADVMKPYQRVGVNFAYQAERCIIADDRGLGKTFEALATVDLAQCNKVLVVAPGYLKYGWEREVKKWTEFRAMVADGERNKRTAVIRRRDIEILIVNYEMLRQKEASGGYPELSKTKWDAIIYDEAHRLKGRDSQWVEGAKRADSRYALLLTGNPIANRPDEIWQLLNILYPRKFTSYWAFVEYYCNVVDTFFGKEIQGVNRAHLAQLQFSLQPIMIRRLKADVAPWLPQKISKVIEVELEGKQKSFYKRAEKEMVLELKDGGLEVIDTIVALNIRLQQALANPCIIGGPDESIIEKTALELIQDLFSSGEKKIIVGMWFTQAVKHFSDILTKHKIKHWSVTGEVAGHKRDAIVEEFKTCEQPCILLGGIKAMSEGINADECDHIIYMDKSWVPLDNEQLEDRIHRMTSTRIKNYYHIVVRGTISADREEVLAEKAEMIDEVLSMKAVTLKMMQRYQS